MDQTIKRLREERLAIWERMKGLLADAEKRDGGLSGELRQSYEAAEAELDAKGAEIETRERFLDTERKLSAPVDEHRATVPAPETATANREEAYRSAFGAWVRRGMTGLTAEQRSTVTSGYVESRDLGVATGGAGGFMVPQGFLVKLTEVQKYFGPMRQVASHIETASGNTMPWPKNDDTANAGSIIGENVAVTELDIVLTQNSLGSFMYTSGLIKVSLQLLNDSAFDVESLVARIAGRRLGRINNTHFTTGTGGGTQPTGITNAGYVANQLAVGNTTTAASYSNLLDTLHTVDVAYRSAPGFAWQMHDTILKGIRKLTDSNGRPLWVPAGSFGTLTAVNGGGDELLGHRVYVNNDLASANAASAKTIFVGDWQSAYIIRDVIGVQMVRLDERFADQLQVGFFAFQRCDGQPDDTKAAAFLQNSAT